MIIQLMILAVSILVFPLLTHHLSKAFNKKDSIMIWFLSIYMMLCVVYSTDVLLTKLINWAMNW